MKEQDIFDAIGNVDPEMVAAADLKPHAKALKCRKFALWAACITIFTVFFSLWLFLPFSSEYKDISKYSESEYYDLMLKVQTLTCHPQNYKFKNNFEKYIMYNLYWVEEQSEQGTIVAGTVMPPLSADKYEEVTDNQFEGIIEGDLFKRSEKCIFYLDPLTLILYSYSTDGAVLLDSINIPDEFGFRIDSVYHYNSILYLSSDCRSVTVILPGYQRTLVVSVNVGSPENMIKGEYFEISGGYITSRMIDGKLLTVTGWGVEPEPDFSDESAYLPQFTSAGKTHSLAADDITFTEDAWRAFYTVVALIDPATMEVIDSAAVLDYTDVVTVSENNIFLSCRAYDSNEEPGEAEGEILGETIYTSVIYTISHKDGALETVGNVKIEGIPTDQYAMDEYNGTLRVVTATTLTHWVEKNYSDGGFSWSTKGRYMNANLYCIDLETFRILGEVVSFAPEGEEITSVRFEGAYGYVCTADTVYHKDPVYVFDLSDPANITSSDTGVIDGYSTSLVDMGGGKLLGIGYGDAREILKVEVYEEKGDRVVSVCSFELRDVEFSEDYKSYYINRADGLVGLMVSREYSSEYVLLYFDGNRIKQIASVTLAHVVNESYTRAVVIDDTLFVFAESQFKAVPLEN